MDTAPDLSGDWLIYFDETTFNRPEPVTKVTRSQYEYDEGGSTRTWDIIAHNNTNKIFTVRETRDDGTIRNYTWNNASQRLYYGATSVFWKQADGKNLAFNVDEKFTVVGEDVLRNQSFVPGWLSYKGPTYDVHNPKSANALLGNSGTFLADALAPPFTSQALGHCNPDRHKNNIYLHCPQISGLDVRGPAPHSSSCVAVLHLMNSNYGDIVAQSTYREHRYVTPPHGVIHGFFFTARRGES